MGSVDAVLEEQLLEAGELLLQPPSSPNELLSHLDQVGKLLGKVDQSPTKSMLTALSPTIKAVVKKEFLRNENEDIRVAVASCISEITRITAPDAPYEDNQMKEVFQLIVSSFENLSDDSSQSYNKRISILETVAKVRSCVVMLDLECDDLIIEMFQHFLKAIRDHHPDTVFSSMEIIMTLVLEESEEIGIELISPILASLKKDHQEVQPIARKLAESVIGKCAEKVKPCLLEAKNSMNISFDDYNRIISEVCGEASNVENDNQKSPAEQLTNDEVADGASSGEAVQGNEIKLDKLSISNEAPQDQVAKESEANPLDEQDQNAALESGSVGDSSVPMETGTEEDHPVPMETGSVEDNPVPVETGSGTDNPVPVETHSGEDNPTSNGVTETENKDVSSEKPENTKEEDGNVGGKSEPGDSDSEKVAKVEPKSAQISKKRTKKCLSKSGAGAPSKSSYTDTDTNKEDKENDGEKFLDEKEIHASPSRDTSAEVAVDKENEKETEESSSPKAQESEPENIVSSTQIGTALDVGRSRKGKRSKKKNNKLSKKKTPPKDVATKMATEGTKKAPASDSPAEKAQAPVKKSKVEEGSESDSDKEILVKKSSRKADAKDHIEDGSSSKKKVDDKRRVQGKSTLENAEKAVPKPSKVVKDVSPLKETVKTSAKRKRTPSKEKATEVKKYGKDLVGTKIKVWWPMDEMFYDGVVDSYDAKNKKHKVVYADGDKEDLNLKTEKWELIEDDDSMEDVNPETKDESPDASPEIPKKKKAKTTPETSGKKGKTESIRDAEASSSKSKGTAKKPSRKEDLKLSEMTPKSSNKSEDIGGKSKVRSKKPAGKSSADASEKAGKSKKEDVDSPKPIIKFKLGSPKSTQKTATKGTPKTSSKDDPKTAMKEKSRTDLKDSVKRGTKSETPKSGGKTSTSSAGKEKSGSSKSAKEIKEKEKSPVKSGKGKSAEVSKESGKKRRRS